VEITDIRIRKINKTGRMRGVISVTFDNEFVVHDIKIISGDNGLFVAMPSKKTADGTFRDVAHPISSQTRNKMQEVILAEFLFHAQNMEDGEEYQEQDSAPDLGDIT